MRTNQASLALSIGMGLIVLLIGLLALSTAGLIDFRQNGAELAAVPISSNPTLVNGDSTQLVAASTYKTVLPHNEAALAAGDALFKNNCAQCHAVNEKVVGPPLAGITMRRQVPWIISWVRNSAKVVASGDEYAVKLYEANDKQQMPSFSNFSESDIKAILTWVEAQQGGMSTACLPRPAVAAN